MKTTLIAFIFAVAGIAQAQSSTATLPASTVQPAAPAQTVTTSLRTEESTWSQKLAASAFMNFAANAKPINYQDSRSQENVGSENWAELAYKLSETSKLGLRYWFKWTASGEKNGNYQSADPSIVYKTTGPKLGAFEPLSATYQLFLPVSEGSRNKHQLTYLRTDVSADYNATTKLVVSPFGQARLYVNSTQNDVNEEGSDSRLRLVGGVNATYNFNDKLNVYYAPCVDIATTDAGRGTLRPNVKSEAAGMEGQPWNTLVHEVGMGLNITKQFSITPAVINYVSLNTGDGFGREDAMEYDLYVSASF